MTGELSRRDYSAHPDFKKNFVQPYTEACNYGKTIIDSLEVVEKDADGIETGRRLANWEKDFAPIYGLPRPAARAKAKEMFGEDAASVMQQYDEIHRLALKKDQALNEWQTGANDREQKSRAQKLIESQKMGETF